MSVKWYEILKALREDKDLTQKELAMIFNTTQRTVSNWESGRNEPPYEILKMYSEYFNVSTDYILKSTKDKSKYNIKNKIDINNNFGKIYIK